MTLTELQAAMGEALGSGDLFGQAREYACEYMNTVGNRTVYPAAEAVTALAGLAERLPAGPTDPADLLQQLNDLGGPATVAQSGGRYFGFVNGGILPPALAVKWLADTWDQNAALHVISPVAGQLEQLCEDWLVELFGLPAGTAAGFVSGTSTATLCGLAAGRDALFAGLGWDIHGQGLFGAPELTVVVGEEAHATVFKALSLLGLGRERGSRVAVDEQGCMMTVEAFCDARKKLWRIV